MKPTPSFRPVHQLALLVALTIPTLAPAADMDPQPNEPPWFEGVRQEFKAKRFDAAVEVLKVANAPTSADWNNLMGYSLRSKTSPDYAAAETHYRKALEIDPKHRGALEYYGELLLIRGDLAGAEGLLKRLDKACFFGCRQYSDLKESVAAYKVKNKPK